MNEKRNIINPDDLEKNETTEEIKAHDLTADEKGEAEAYFSEHIKSLIDVKNVSRLNRNVIAAGKIEMSYLASLALFGGR